MNRNLSQLPMSNDSNGNSTSGSESGGQQTSSTGSSVSNYVILPILSLTDVFALIYIITILVRPTLRNNKLNWFTVNVCLTTLLQSTIMLQSTIRQLLGVSSTLSCRLLTYISVVGASQMMYSHAVTSISRFLAIVYANKHIFRSNLCVILFILSGWLIGFTIVIPYFLVDGFGCSSPTAEAFLPYYTLTILLLIPAITVFTSNAIIFIFVSKSSRRVHTEGGRPNAAQARDLRLIKTMILTFAVFFSGWGPLFIEQTFAKSGNIAKAIDTIFQILPPISMFFDVILLIYINQPMRSFLWQLIIRRPQQPDQTNTFAHFRKTKADNATVK